MVYVATESSESKRYIWTVCVCLFGDTVIIIIIIIIILLVCFYPNALCL
jgi:hypothetical protein